MSAKLLEFAQQFVDGRMGADPFVEGFIESWKQERDCGVLQQDSPDLSETLSTIFCLADLYCPDATRREYELDAISLRQRVSDLMPRKP